MAEEKAAAEATPEEQQATGAGGDAAGQVRVRWDGSEMTTTYANVCNVSSTREEVTLLFGTNETWATGSEVQVKLSDRIVLNPYAAKRLSMLLTNVVNEYEKRFGKLDVQTGA